MKTPHFSIALVALGLICTMALPQTMSTVAAEESITEQCLMCHGDYEALREKTKDWKDEFGDQIQPHQYLDSDNANPHSGKKIVPECTNCHEKHPVPPPSDFKFKDPTFSTCYGCHHMENFQKCSSSGCHEN